MKFDTTSIETFMKAILDTSYFEPNPSFDNTPAIDAVLDPGESSLVLITGDNASGKSFLRRLISQALRGEGVECMHLSMEGRATGGIERAFLYGAEDWEATGYISSRGVTTGIRTCKSRENKHVIFWDEPDLGLSEDYAAGAGVLIRDFVKDMPELTFGAFIVTHCRALVRQLVPAKPWHLRLGGCPPLKTWLKHWAKPKSLDLLKEEQSKRFRRIQEILDRKDKKRGKAKD